MGIKLLQLHKRASYEYKYIQDKYALNIENRCFAMADGTTQSFNSEIWAEMITSSFVASPTFSAVKLINLFFEQATSFKNLKFQFSSNPAKASLEKTKQNQGSTATFMGLRFTSQSNVEVITCGDTNLFILNSEKLKDSFPYTDIDRLDANNCFINTVQLLDGKFNETFFNQKHIDVVQNDIVILSTDALSRLILKNPDVLKHLLRIENFNQLLDFCEKYWESKELEEDDITAIIIPINGMDNLIHIHPPTDFSFTREQEQEFNPNIKKYQKKYTEMEMNEIRNQFSGVAQDFHQVKNHMKVQKVLLIMAIVVLILNTISTYFFRPTSINDGRNESYNAIIHKYDNEIENFKLEIKKLKSDVADFTRLKSEQKVERPAQKKTNPYLTKEEAKKRQEELIKAGYNITPDGVWGSLSEKKWDEYQQNKKGKN